MCCNKLVTHTESHASAVSLLDSGEQSYIKKSLVPMASFMKESRSSVAASQ